MIRMKRGALLIECTQRARREIRALQKLRCRTDQVLVTCEKIIDANPKMQVNFAQSSIFCLTLSSQAQAAIVRVTGRSMLIDTLRTSSTF
jgi:hypothetical protein